MGNPETHAGLIEARRRIAAAKAEGSTFLDLSKLDLAFVPAELIELVALRSLHLGSNRIDNGGARAIAEGLTALTSLNLGNNLMDDGGAKAIAEGLTALTSLNLGNNRIGNGGARAIAEGLTALKSLNLGDNRIGEDGARAIAEGLTGLTSLDLGDNRIGNGGVKAIAEGLTALKSLDLGNNLMNNDGVRAIAEGLTALKSLDLRNNRIGDGGAKAIAKGLTALASLDLHHNQIGHGGARAIAKRLTALTSLGLGLNRIGDGGTRAIAEGLTALTSLDLHFNQIGNGGAKAIAESLTALTSLDLHFNQIGDGGARVIAEGLTALKSLDLRNNRIGDGGAKAIAKGLTALTSLELGNNRIGDGGAKAIAKGLTTLTSLDLRRNEIGEDSARMIAERLTALTSLDLRRNEIGQPWDATADAHAIRRNLAQSRADAGGQPIREFKIALVGAGEAGKSWLRRALTGKPVDPQERRTHNVHADRIGPGEIDGLGAPLRGIGPDGEDGAARLFDFGGQPWLLGAHRLFLSDRRSVYVLVLNATWAVEQNRLGYWLRYLMFHVPSAPIVVVVTQCDQKRRLPADDALRQRIDTIRKDAHRAMHRAPSTADTEPVEPPKLSPLTLVDDVCSGNPRQNIEPAWAAITTAARGLTRVWTETFAPWVVAAKEELERDLTRVDPELHEDAVLKLEEGRAFDPHDHPFEADADNRRKLKHKHLPYDGDQSFAGYFKVPDDQVVDDEQYRIYAGMLDALGTIHCLRPRIDRHSTLAAIPALYETVYSPQWVRYPVYRVLWAANHQAGRPAAGPVMTPDRYHEIVRETAPIESDRRLLRTFMQGCGLIWSVESGRFDVVADWLGDRPTGAPRPSGWDDSLVVTTGRFPVLLADDLLPRVIGRLWHERSREPHWVYRDAFLWQPPPSTDWRDAAGNGPSEPLLLTADIEARELEVRVRGSGATDPLTPERMESLRPALRRLENTVYALLRPENSPPGYAMQEQDSAKSRRQNEMDQHDAMLEARRRSSRDVIWEEVKIEPPSSLDTSHTVFSPLRVTFSDIKAAITRVLDIELNLPRQIHEIKGKNGKKEMKPKNWVPHSNTVKEWSVEAKRKSHHRKGETHRYEIEWFLDRYEEHLTDQKVTEEPLSAEAKDLLRKALRDIASKSQ